MPWVLGVTQIWTTYGTGGKKAGNDDEMEERISRMEDQYLRKEDTQKGCERMVEMEGKGAKDFCKIKEQKL